MPDFSMFGPAENGTYVAQVQQQQMQMNNLAMQATMQQIQASKAQEAEREQKTRMEQQQQEQKQKQQAAMQKIAMDQRGKSLEDLGTSLKDAGFIDEGAKILKDSAEIVEKSAQADKAKADTVEMKLKQNQALFTTLGKVAAVTTNDAEWQGYIKQIEQRTGQKVPDQIKNAKWTPEFQKKVQNFAMERKDQLELKLKEQNQASEAALRTEEIRLDKAREGLIAAQTQLTIERDVKLQKNDGPQSKVARTPKEDVATVMHMLRNQYPDIELDDKGHVKDLWAVNASEYIAGEAQAIMKKNPAVSRPQALEQAYLKHKDDITEGPKKGGFFGMGGTTGHKWNASAKTDPAMPKESQGPMTPESYAKLQPGDTYIDSDGNTRRKK